MFLVKLPIWKAYLYSLMERIRLYYAINNQTYNFGFNYDDKLLLKRMFKKYTQKGGGYRDIRTLRYKKLIDSVRANQVIATQDELEMVIRLSIVNLINVEDLMQFEIKQLKELAKEVGINALAAAKMKPEELAKEIIKSVDPKKGYSTEFVKWYDSVPDDLLNSIDATGGEESGEGGDNAELIEAINTCTKMGELKEIVADEEIGALFKGFDISKHKIAGPCKKAMIDFLSTKSEVKESADDSNKEELVKGIMEAANDDELVAVLETANELFSDFDPGEVTDLDELKQLILTHIGVEPVKEEKKMSLKDKLKQKKEKETPAPATTTDKLVIDFDPTAGNFDAEKVYEQADALGIGQLKKFYSQISKITRIEMPSNKPGISKDALLDGLGNALMDLFENGPKEDACVCTPGAGEADSEITKQLVEDAAKAEDKESLVAMCDKMGIALNPLEKRNVTRMKEKLIAKLPEEKSGGKKLGGALARLKSSKPAVKEEEAAAPSEKSKLVEIFSIVEKMVLEESEEKDIVAAVTPLYKELGCSALKIKSRVKVLIEVVQVDHNLKK